MRSVDRAVVVVPAHDEEELLPMCLTSVLAAAAAARAGHPGLRCHVLVVLDHCSDATAARAGAFPVLTLTSRRRGVGAARREGALAGLRLALFDGCPPERTWLASTDADCVVPEHWLTGQLELSLRGADVVIGTVEPDGLTDAVALRRWHERHDLAEGHPYVHGANLGVRGSAYVAAGGFGEETVAEDVNLVRRLIAGPHRCVATDLVRVRTSGRTTGQVTGGFADYLLGLYAESE